MKMRDASAHLCVLMVLAAFAFVGCEGDAGPAGPAGPAGAAGPTGPPGDAEPLTCVQCHDETNIVTGKTTQWEESVHGMGEAYVRGTSTSCVGCHSGNGFAIMLDAGLAPNTMTEGDPNPTRQDCRACHVIHSTYTMADFALRTEAPVDFYAIAGSTFDGGDGNLCANCHQPRRTIPDPVGGVISGISEHWGPHHGAQSNMMLGVGGAPGVTGTAHAHYSLVTDTCVSCHMGEGLNHNFEPDTDNCQTCHPGLDSFDHNGVQTEIVALADSLGAMLVTAGLIDENSPDGHPIVTEAPEGQARALWNWLFVSHEDKSKGVHNAAYARDLLNAGIAELPAP